MKKILKVLICAVLAMTMVLSFTACDDKGAELSRETVEAFMEAYTDLDMEKAAQYCSDDIAEELEDMLTDNPLFNIEKTMTDAIGGTLPDDMMADIVKLCDDLIEEVKGKFSYTIDDPEEKDGEYIYPVSVTVPDMDAVNMDEIMESAQEDYAEKGMAIVMELYENGEITDDMSEEKIQEVVIEKVGEILVEMMGDMFDEAMSKVETAEEEIDITVSKVDDKWIITKK